MTGRGPPGPVRSGPPAAGPEVVPGEIDRVVVEASDDPVDLARGPVVRGTGADRTGLAGPGHAVPSAIEPSGIDSQDGRFLASYSTS